MNSNEALYRFTFVTFCFYGRVSYSQNCQLPDILVTCLSYTLLYWYVMLYCQSCLKCNIKVEQILYKQINVMFGETSTFHIECKKGGKSVNKSLV